MWIYQVRREKLSTGANVAAQDNQGLTPLMWAAVTGRDAMVKLLLAAGADVSAKDHVEVLGWTALYHGINQGHEAVVRELIGKGEEFSAEGIAGHCPLHLAASRGNVAVVLLLIDKGAEVSVTNNVGETPLHHAAWFCQMAAILLLIDKGAELSAKDHVGDTPLHNAASRGHFDAVRLLLDKGADLASVGNETAEEMATDNGHHQIAAMLKAEAAGLHLEVAAILEAGSTPTPNLRPQTLNPRP